MAAGWEWRWSTFLIFTQQPLDYYNHRRIRLPEGLGAVAVGAKTSVIYAQLQKEIEKGKQEGPVLFYYNYYFHF